MGAFRSDGAGDAEFFHAEFQGGGFEVETLGRHPESNGIVERFNGTLRAGSDDGYGENYLMDDVSEVPTYD